MLLIDQVTNDPVVDLCLDVLKLNKQSIVFVNTKKSAEACAEKISNKLLFDEQSSVLAERAENSLSHPTKQCKRLGKILKKGVAFHHSGLSSSQRTLIEEGFRSGIIKIICSTTTLGAGLDLPAYRCVIRDLKRFSPGWGSVPIPVLEFEQMAGRAGRPSFDSVGEAICVASSPEEQEFYWEEYINGVPEDIHSKLVVEPVLRTYVLSLIASGYASSFSSLLDFMNLTLYAHMNDDLGKLKRLLFGVVELLEGFDFLSSSKVKKEDFVSAHNLSNDFKLSATLLGKRVSELYIDPLTANQLIGAMKNADKEASVFSVLHLISSTLEIRPLFNLRKKDEDLVERKLELEKENLLVDCPVWYSEEQFEFLTSIKTAIVFEEWMSEKSEDFLFDEYSVSPGELSAKLNRADWLLYSCSELLKVVGGVEKSFFDFHKIRTRLNHGVLDELLPLIKFKGVGRVRARKLFNNRIRDSGDVKKIDFFVLSELIGRGVALSIKKQVGQDLSEEKVVVKKNKRKGQISLNDF